VVLSSDALSEWKQRSEAGEICGILGCYQNPVIQCPKCLNWYCDEHKDIHFHKADEKVSEWLDEPDRDEFEYAGLKCLILRHPEIGHLCGYVAVPKGYLCYGRHHDHLPYDDIFPIQVHGGLTWSKSGDGKTWPEGYWWLGFDCAHAWDLAPYMLGLIPHTPIGIHGTYRNLQYVREETGKLASQIATIDFIDWQFQWVWPLLLPVGAARGIWSKRRKVSV